MKHKLLKKLTIFRPDNSLIWFAVGTGLIIGLCYIVFNINDSSIRVAGIGQVASTPETSLQVQSVTEVPSRELFSGKIVDGEKGLIVRFRVQNKTDKNQLFLPVNQAFVKGDDGNIYKMTPVTGVREAIKAGEIPAGEAIEGEISFMVKDSSRGLRLYLDTRWGNNPPLVVALE